jgi:hypothetical protein
MGLKVMSGGLVAALLLTVAGPALAEPALMPLPKAVVRSEGTLPLEGRFVVAWTGCRDARLDRAVERFQTDLGRLTGIELRRRGGPRLEIACCAADALSPKGLEGAPEAYRLSVTATGVRL